MNPFNWVPALNTKLPATLRIMACEEVAADFHSRFSAVGKIYHYDLCTDPVLPPLKAGLAWHLPRLLDAAVLEQALGLFCGRHDFHAFAAYRGNEQPDMDWCRTIHRAELETLADGYRITFVGDGFLYKMVRLLTGAAVHAAQGRIRIDELAALLTAARPATREIPELRARRRAVSAAGALSGVTRSGWQVRFDEGEQRSAYATVAPNLLNPEF